MEKSGYALLIFTIGVLGVNGQIKDGKFQNPINPGPDPYCDFFEGNYYLTTTQGDAIRMWKSPNLGSLKTAKSVTIWTDSNPSRCRGIWAPEFHFITNHWYVYYTATSADGKDANHRLYVLESKGANPLGPYHFKGRLFDPDNDRYAIDPTVFKNPGDGRWYSVWAADPGHLLRMAKLSNPWTIEGHSVVIPASGFGCANIREAPEMLQHLGLLFLVYSACDTGAPDYKLGMLMAGTNSDLLNPLSWEQYPKPIFERSDRNGVFGPGHNGFFHSPDGAEDWIIYHAKTNSFYTYKGRETRAQKFTWNADGTPNFGEPIPLSTVLDEPSAYTAKKLRPNKF
jgi:GH43 family beta-xylosidase